MSLIGQEESVGAAIAGPCPPYQPTLGLQPVDQIHDAARRQPKGLGKLALGTPFGTGDIPEHHHRALIQASRTQPLTPQSRRLRTDLGREEGDAAAAEQLVPGRRGRHVLSAMVWVGGGLTLMLIAIRARSNSDPGAISDLARTLPYEVEPLDHDNIVLFQDVIDAGWRARGPGQHTACPFGHAEQ